MVWKKKQDEVEEEVVEQVPEKQSKVELKELVVSELPQTPTRVVRGEDGVSYHLVTQTEALQEILAGVRELLERTKD